MSLYVINLQPLSFVKSFPNITYLLIKIVDRQQKRLKVQLKALPIHSKQRGI